MGQMLGYAIAQIGSSALGAALSPDPFQKRQSFAGTGADPASWMTDARYATNNVLNGAVNRANSPIDVGGNMPLNDNPSFSGGGLPMTISSPNRQPPRVHLDGFGLQTPVTGLPGSTINQQNPDGSPSAQNGQPNPAFMEGTARKLNDIVNRSVHLGTRSGAVSDYNAMQPQLLAARTLFQHALQAQQTMAPNLNPAYTG